ncbi:hypothetical protein CDAR_365611 [Caerostris darwini]|uniref:Uncharacterized protein n=1 Tax=Caerostris darwini TaxID=1538125 RepID=A0AAV4REK1_9ARAC|nr:hypothetical protein CDAR_365611 [Caerostris darwini]
MRKQLPYTITEPVGLQDWLVICSYASLKKTVISLETGPTPLLFLGHTLLGGSSIRIHEVGGGKGIFVNEVVQGWVLTPCRARYGRPQGRNAFPT